MSAAARARRVNEDASITVLEKSGFISFANCGLPYYIGGKIAREEDLLVITPKAVMGRFNLDVRIKHEATRIDRATKTVHATDHVHRAKLRVPYDKLIIATGAMPIIPQVEHVDAKNVFLLRSMEDTQAVHAWMEQKKPKRVTIVGAGFIGLEMADAMRERGLDVTVVEKAPHALPPIDQEMAQPIAEELARHEVNLIVGCGLVGFHASSDGLVDGVKLEDDRVIDTDMVMLSIGVRPNAALAVDAGLTIGATGGVAVDEFQRTSDPDIYAVGDVAEVVHGVTGQHVRIPLAGPANRQGRIAGEHAAAGSSPPAGKVMGTAIVQVFDLAVGVTGLSERDAKRMKLDVATAYVMPGHHAGYYPGAQTMRIKLIYEKPSGRIIGAQAVGAGGVDKRIDVLATAMHFGGTIDDLATLDLAYAPQFASAKDAVHMAAFVAQNQQRGLMDAVSPRDIDDEQLVDVRSPAEFAAGTLDGAVNIPLDELRTRLGELDPGRSTVTFCKIGLRGYIAQRILRQHGFKRVKNMQGGYELAKAMGVKSVSS